jgi:hypothetical protein
MYDEIAITIEMGTNRQSASDACLRALLKPSNRTADSFHPSRQVGGFVPPPS